MEEAELTRRCKRELIRGIHVPGSDTISARDPAYSLPNSDILVLK